MSGKGGGSWKVAYADFVTAMMAFFLLMWILNMTPPETKKVLVGYFAASGGYTPSPNQQIGAPPLSSGQGGNQEISKGLTPADKESLNLAITLTDKLSDEHIPNRNIKVSPNEYGVLLRVDSGLMFAPEKVEISAEGAKVLDVIIGVLKQSKLYLVVRGHTDTSETGAPNYSSKWELSAARAAAAVNYIVEKGKLDPTMIIGMGLGDSRPVTPDTDPVSAAQNRRVEFFFHRPELMQGLMGF